MREGDVYGISLWEIGKKGARVHTKVQRGEVGYSRSRGEYKRIPGVVPAELKSRHLVQERPVRKRQGCDGT